MRSHQIIIGYTTEGKSDCKFLEDVILRTFQEIVYECPRSVEILNVIYIPKKHGLTYDEEVKTAAKEAFNIGANILCVHSDADDCSDIMRFHTKIDPAFAYVNDSDDNDICRCLVPIVPIYMIESWMLADKQLLKAEIGTNMSDGELRINVVPETCSTPKDLISDAIRIARQQLPQRRRKDLTIHDLYISMGYGVDLNILSGLSSYSIFRLAVRRALQSLNLLP